MTIAQWLNSERDYGEGLELLKKAGVSNALYGILSKGPSFYNRTRLAKELSNSLTKKPSNSKKASSSLAKSLDRNAVKSIEPGSPANETKHEPLALAPYYKILKEQYSIVNHFHPLLDATYNLDRKRSFEIKLALQDAWNEIEGLYRIIHYYQEHGQILPNKYLGGENNLDLDPKSLIKRRNNLRSYISRHKDNPRKAVKVEAWRAELVKLEALIN